MRVWCSMMLNVCFLCAPRNLCAAVFSSVTYFCCNAKGSFVSVKVGMPPRDGVLMDLVVRDGFDVFVEQETACTEERLSLAEAEPYFSLPCNKFSGMFCVSIYFPFSAVTLLVG